MLFNPFYSPVVEPPLRPEVLRQRLATEAGADEFDGDRVLAEDRVVEVAVGHLARFHQLPVQRAKLQPADHAT